MTTTDLIVLLNAVKEAQNAYELAAHKAGFLGRVAEDDIHLLYHVANRLDDGELTVESLDEAFGAVLAAPSRPNLLGGNEEYVWSAFVEDMDNALEAAGIRRPEEDE